ncbi:TPA: hypothetical protein ACH3X1_001605 [Trebouxia sp. C0004]
MSNSPLQSPTASAAASTESPSDAPAEAPAELPPMPSPEGPPAAVVSSSPPPSPSASPPSTAPDATPDATSQATPGAPSQAPTQSPSEAPAEPPPPSPSLPPSPEFPPPPSPPPPSSPPANSDPGPAPVQAPAEEPTGAPAELPATSPESPSSIPQPPVEPLPSPTPEFPPPPPTVVPLTPPPFQPMSNSPLQSPTAAAAASTESPSDAPVEAPAELPPMPSPEGPPAAVVSSSPPPSPSASPPSTAPDATPDTTSQATPGAPSQAPTQAPAEAAPGQTQRLATGPSPPPPPTTQRPPPPEDVVQSVNPPPSSLLPPPSPPTSLSSPPPGPPPPPGSGAIALPSPPSLSSPPLLPPSPSPPASPPRPPSPRPPPPSLHPPSPPPPYPPPSPGQILVAAVNVSSPYAALPTVKDTTPPIITILGANPYRVTQGQAYNDPGATAYDALDGAITAITVSGVKAVNTMEVFVRHRVYGTTPSSVPPGRSTYTDPGATATDNVDGNITSRLTTYGVGAVKTVAPTATASPYVITYNVIDSSGNQATPGLRYLVVTCKSPTVTCTASDGTLFCSTSFGVCIKSTTVVASTTGTAPAIRLIGQAVLGLTEGTSYLACPTPQPTNVICDRQGYAFVQQGISSCAVNTSAAVGTTFAINFTVFDYSIPSLNASVVRTGPPGLQFVAYGNSSTSVTTGYGVAATVPLLPCTALDNTTDCGAVATDSTGTDISSSIVVVDVTPCAAGAQCPACAITFAAAGLCQPGPYLYLYRAKDSYTSLASAWRLVQVQQQYAVTLSLPVTLQAADLAAAQAQASTLTTGSNATSLIASAVAAGLISEFSSAPNLTAAAAAQNLTWAPVSLSLVTVDSYSLAMATSDSALLILSLTAELGVSGDITDVADVTGSRKRRLLQTSASLTMDSSVVSSSLSSASGVSVTALNSSSSYSTGAQLKNYSLITAPVDNHRSVLSGLLANLTCIRAELYQMEAALSTGEDPLWVVPYTTVANDFHSLLQDYTAYVEFTQKQLGSIYAFLVEQIAAIIRTEESALAVVDGTKSASTPLTTAPGCARDANGNLRLQFYANAENITREIDGLLASRRRLQSTPCSSTVGTSLALNYTTTSVTIAGNTTPVYSNSDLSEAVYVQRLLPRIVGWSGNQVVAGVLLQTLRNSVSHTCNQRFDGFITVCTEQPIAYDEVTGEAVVVPTSSGGLRPYGVDAVFLADSSAYDETLAVADFYNTSASSDEITPYTGTPLGFRPRAMLGFPLGFPVVFDNRLSRNESQRLWTILSDGNFLDEDTASVTVRLLTYNPKLQVYGYARVDFSWDSAGLIDVVTRFVAIPDVTLSLSSNKIDQTVLAAFVLNVLLTAAQLSVLMYSLFCEIRQTSTNWNTVQEAFGKTWVLYDMALFAAMLICLITYSVYIHSLVDFQPQSMYEVYDSLGGAQARLLLPKKQDPSTYNVSAPSTYTQVPGGAGRWTLPDVNTGLDSMAAMYTQADKMADEMTLYTTLQGITMQLLILRLIKVLSAQKRLSILTTTAVKAIPWIMDVGYTVMCVALMLAVMGHVLFGDFEVTMATLPDSISGYFEVMFTQQVATYNQDLGVTNTAPMQMNWLLRSEAYAWYFLPPISSIFILWWFLRVIIVSSFREEAEGQKRIVGIHHDMATLFAELSQNLRGAPSSAFLAELFEWAAPRSMKVNIWARLRGQQAQLTIQERQRQGIHGVHMRSLDQHLDQQDLQKLLGEVIHHTRASIDPPAPDHQVLAKVLLSRFGGLLHDWPESYFQAQQTKGVGLAGIFKQAIGQQRAQKATRTRSVLARMFPGSTVAKLGTQDAYEKSAGGAKSGVASLMRQAVRQAKVEAAAQAAAGTWQASHDGLPGDSQKAAETDVTRKKALAARLQKAAQRMQQEEAKSVLAGQEQEPSTAANQVCFQQADSDASDDLEPTQLSQHNDAENPDQQQMSDLADLQADRDLVHPPVKIQSLGNRLGSILKSAFSPSRQSSYIPLDADSPPEAKEANEAPEQALNSSGRRSLPRDASLGQRLGSILKGALSLPRQPSYTSLSGDEDFDSSDPYGDSGRRALPRELSLHEQFSSLSRQASNQLDADNAQRVLPRELSLRERYGSMSLSRDPSCSSPLGHSFAGPEADTELPVPMSPGKRRALPRDASYLPDWVTRTHRQTPRGNGNASPRSRLGTSFSSVSTSSDHEDDSFMPRWVDWPQSSLHPQDSPEQAEEEADNNPTPAAPILQAPPHLRRQQKEVQKAEAALPRAKRPLSLASNPLSLSLVHTPSMNPQLDLRPCTPVATPKGQRLFDFWHQKTEQPVTAAGPANIPDIQSGPVTHASQQVHGGAQQLASSAIQQAESSTGADAAQLNAAQAPQGTHQADSLPGIEQSDGSHQQPVSAAGLVQGLDAGDEQLNPVSAVLLAELETASRLVHKQSVQQAELLKGIEHALSQLSEQRLLIQDPHAVAVMSHQEDVSHNGITASPMLEADLASNPAQHLSDGPLLQLPAGDSGDLLPVQSAEPQVDSDQKPELASSTSRRRQSFNFADSRLRSLMPTEAGWAQRGQPSGDPKHHSSTTAATSPPVPARQEAATAGPPCKVVTVQLPAPAPGLQPGGAAKLAQPALKQKLKTAVVHKTNASSDGKPKPDSKAQTALPTKSSSGQSGQRKPLSGELGQAQRQGSSLAQLVEKYKTDSAARKLVHNEVTLERISSLAAGLQHAAAGKLSDTRSRAPSSVQKQAADATAVLASSSRPPSATKNKVAAGAKPEAAKAANVARPLPFTSSKSMRSTAKGKASMKPTAGASGARFHKNNKGTQNQSSSDSD